MSGVVGGDLLRKHLVKSENTMTNMVRETESLIKETRAVNPGPGGSAFIFTPGSGSRREKLKNIKSKNTRDLVIILF